MATALTVQTCSKCIAYNEELNSKADEIKALQEHVLELAHKIQDEGKRKAEVQERLNDQLITLNDYSIKIRNLEEQLQSASDRYPIGELSRAEVHNVTGRDFERIHAELIEKDMKIMDLNDKILEKERHIIELQEMFREQKELVQAKARAFHIIQQKLLDLSRKTTREDSTETEAAYVFDSSFSPLSSLQQPLKGRHQHDFFSPGHAVVHFKMGSPPPIDPSEECSSTTQDNGNVQDDVDADDGGSTSSSGKKKHRKKVTFDLPPRKEFRNVSGQDEAGDITQAFIDVTIENDQLRQTIQEMEKYASDSQNHLSQLQIQLDEMRRSNRIQVLKARASMQGKIRDLEDKISTMNTEHAEKIEHLNASIETLRADREWTLEENARLLKFLGSYKEKLNDAWEALDARQEEIKELRLKLDNDRALIVQLADELEEAQQTSSILLEQKISVLDDVERLKEALEAQDQYIELLEKDTMIYEKHVGLLRDSLGASKAERKALIKSKAYETKLKALEQEKEQLNRRNTDEKLHIKALNLKIRSLETERTVLKARNDELESRLIHQGKNVPPASVIASSADALTSDAVESTSNLTSSGSAFKPVYSQTKRHNQKQTTMKALQWPVPESNAAAYEHQYEEEFVNNMRVQLDTAHQEYSMMQEKIVQMSCANFELEHQLKDAKEKLEEAEIRVRQAESQTDEARWNYEQQKKHHELSQSEFSAKLSVLEGEVNGLKEELDLKTKQLSAKTIENDKRNEEMKQWRFAVDEVEALHTEIQILQNQLSDEKIAMESKWAEVRKVFLERKENVARKTSDAKSVASGEQSTVNQLGQMADAISDLKNTVDKQAKQLELEKAKKRKYKAVISQLRADKKALLARSVTENEDGERHVVQLEARIASLQRQRDFMDREMTLLCALNNSKDVLIKTLKAKHENVLELESENDDNEDKVDPIEQLQEKLEIMSQEKSQLSRQLVENNAELQKLRVRTQQLQMECDRLQLQLQFSPRQSLDAVASTADTCQHVQLQQAQQQVEFINSETGDSSMDAELGAGTGSTNRETEQANSLTSSLQRKDTELRKVLDENEALKIKCIESTAALDLLSVEFERRSQEKDGIIEMLQSQHTYLTRTILCNERNAKHLATVPTVSQSTNTALTVMEGAANDRIVVVQSQETQTEADFHFLQISETGQELTSELLRQTVHDEEVCQFANKSDQMDYNLTDEVKHLLTLNAELETAVEVLKGEIWTLNEQLKESLVDREDLSDKLCELSQRHEEEIERARERERDLEEQKDMAEKSQRQAALAENESNRRLVEWQEKSAEMENDRLELENAYAKLSEYYQQLQQAYNVLYARFNACKVDRNTQTAVDGNTIKVNEEYAEKIKCLKDQLAQRETEMKKQLVELQHVRNLLREHCHVALQNIRDLREMNLELLKDVIVNNEQTMQAQLRKVLKEVRSYEETINKLFKEKELEDATLEMKAQQLGLAPEQDTSAATKYGTSGREPWNCSTPCTICRELKQTKQPAQTPQLQLAILAARLTTKIADNDALFRCNAELVQTNLRLQNEVDELREQMARSITSSNDNCMVLGISEQSLTQQQNIPKPFSNQSSEEEVMHTEEKEWAWRTSDFDTGSTITKGIQVANLGELVSQEQDIENLEKLNGTKERSKECKEERELVNGADEMEEQLDDSLRSGQNEDATYQQKLEINQTICEELLPVQSQDMLMTDLVENPKQNMEMLNEELQATKTERKTGQKHCKQLQMEFTVGSEKQNEGAERKAKENEHGSRDNVWVPDDVVQELQTLLEEQVQYIPRDDAAENGKMQLLQELEEQLHRKDTECQKLEEKNRSMEQQLTLQQQLIEMLEKKLCMMEECSMTLEKKNISMEQEIIGQKKKYEELLIEKDRLIKKAENEVRTKLHGEIESLKEESDRLVLELTRKQTLLDEEKAKLENCEIVLEKLKRKLKHSEEKNIQMQRELDDYNARISEQQQKNEVDQGFSQRLVEAQKTITELKCKLNQVVEQNELLKNGEQKLMDALTISNERLAETESKNKRLKSEISSLRVSLRQSEETVHPEKSIAVEANAMAKMYGKAAKSPVMIHPHNILVEESAQEANCSALKEKEKYLSGTLGTSSVSSVVTAVPFKVDVQNLNEIESTSNNKGPRKEISSFDDSFEPVVQRTTHYLGGVITDKLRRRRGRTSGFQGAENI